MILPASYSNGFAPRDGQPLYPELWRGCVGAWAPCLGPSGLTLRDWSGYANHGTLTNGPSWGPSFLSFDGTNDSVVSERNTGLIGSQLKTVTGWVKLTATPPLGTATILNMGIANTGGSAFEALINTTNVTLHSYGAGNAAASVTVNTLNNWIFFAIGNTDARDGFVFANGLRVTGTYSSSFGHPSTTMKIGGPPSFSGFNYFTGQISEIRVYARALSDSVLNVLATRRGIAYELAPRRRYVESIASFNRRRRLLLGASN